MQIKNKLFVKQQVAMVTAIPLVLLHLVMTPYFWLRFSGSEVIIVEQLTLPITAAYVTTAVRWVVDRNGLVRPKDYIYVGFPYVFIVAVFAIFISIAYVGGAVLYEFRKDIMGKSELNAFYLIVETTLGGAFAYIFSDLYGRRTDQN